MPALNVARLSNLLRGLFVLRGQDTVAPEINDELQGVVILEGERPEHRFLAGDFLCSAHVRVPAVAGTRGEVRVINPAGSGRICADNPGDRHAGAFLCLYAARWECGPCQRLLPGPARLAQSARPVLHVAHVL